MIYRNAKVDELDQPSLMVEEEVVEADISVSDLSLMEVVDRVDDLPRERVGHDGKCRRQRGRRIERGGDGWDKVVGMDQMGQGDGIKWREEIVRLMDRVRRQETEYLLDRTASSV